MKFFVVSLTIALVVIAGEREPDRAAFAEALGLSDSLTAIGRLDEAAATLDSTLSAIASPERMDTALARAYHKLGAIHLRRNAPEQALPFLTKALEIRRELLGRNNMDVARTLYNIGLANQQLGCHKLAEETLRESLSIRESMILADSTALCDNLSTLGTVLFKSARFTEAEENFARCLRIRLHDLPLDTARTVQAYLNLAGAVESQGRHLDALAILSECVAECRPQDVSRALAAKVHETMGEVAFNNFDYSQADSAFDTALRLLRSLTLKDSIPLFDAKYGKARCLLRCDSLEPAGRFIEENLTLLRAQPEPDSARFWKLYTPYADWLELSGRNLDAIAVLTELRGAFERRRCVFDPQLAGVSASLAVNWMALDSLTDAWECASAAYSAITEALRATASALPDAQALEIAGLGREIGGNAISVLLECARKSQTADTSVAALVATQKAQVLELVELRAELLRHSKEFAHLAMYDSLTTVQQELASIFLDPRADREEGRQNNLPDSLKRRALELERRIITESNARAGNPLSLHSFQDIATAIPDKTIFVEYLRYNRRVSSTESLAHYVAYVAADDGTCRVAELGPASKIDSLIARHAKAIAVAASPIARSEAAMTRLLRDLYNALLLPFADRLNDVSHILVSPDSQIGLVSFASLMDTDTTFLIEAHGIGYVNSARDLLFENRDEKSEGLIAFADPAFESESYSKVGEGGACDTGVARAVASTLRRDPELRTASIATPVPLPGTRAEVTRVADAWRDDHSQSVAIFTGREASESRFFQNARGHACVYVATHGFSDLNGVPDDPFYAGFKSGFLLAKDETSKRTSDDGVVTANELRELDLTGTHLFVLSACESARGAVFDGEGVLGVRRALHASGVEQILGTLWKVDDAATADLMSEVATPEVSAVAGKLRSAMLEHIARRRSEGLFPHPFEWAAFVLSCRGGCR